MSFIFGDGGASQAAQREAELARMEEQKRQARIDAGMSGIDSAFSSFNDDFFNNRAAAYGNFAMPQLQDQFGDARENLTYALARQGILDSSSSADRFTDLDKTYDFAIQDINNQGIDYANQARSSVEDARSGVVNQLFATEDPDAALTAAANQSAALTAKPAFNNIANYFQNITAGLASAFGGPQTGYGGLVSNITPGGSLSNREKVIG